MATSRNPEPTLRNPEFTSDNPEPDSLSDFFTQGDNGLNRVWLSLGGIF